MKSQIVAGVILSLSLIGCDSSSVERPVASEESSELNSDTNSRKINVDRSSKITQKYIPRDKITANTEKVASISLESPASPALSLPPEMPKSEKMLELEEERAALVAERQVKMVELAEQEAEQARMETQAEKEEAIMAKQAQMNGNEEIEEGEITANFLFIVGLIEAIVDLIEDIIDAIVDLDAQIAEVDEDIAKEIEEMNEAEEED